MLRPHGRSVAIYRRYQLRVSRRKHWFGTRFRKANNDIAECIVQRFWGFCRSIACEVDMQGIPIKLILRAGLGRFDNGGIGRSRFVAYQDGSSDGSSSARRAFHGTDARGTLVVLLHDDAVACAECRERGRAFRSDKVPLQSRQTGP